MQWQIQPDMPLSYFRNIIIAVTESNTLEFPGVDRGTSSSPKYMNIHKNQHPNVKPFSYTQCASKLVNPADLKIHKN